MKTPTSLSDIEAFAKRLSTARELLTEHVDKLNQQMAQLKRDALPAIKRAVAACAERHADLLTLVEGAPELFLKPRTVIFHGVKLGFEKGKGKIQITDKAKTIALIRKHLDDAIAGFLISTKESVNKKSLRDLTVDDLKRIGCTVEETGDAPIIRFTDSAVDKIVHALLADALSDETNTAAAA